jgi:hypothetical protein
MKEVKKMTKKNATKIKESEEEEEERCKEDAKKDAEEEEGIGRLNRPKKQRFEKEDEDEEEEDEDEEEEDDSKGREGIRYKKKKKKLKKEDEDDETEEEEEETEEEARKSEGSSLGQTPQESAESSSTDEHTTTPGKMTGKPQNVFTPQSGIPGNRMGTGRSPSEITYSGKSVEPDLMKSPLFVELSGEIEDLQKAVAKKVDAIEKSVSDRLDNIQKSVEKIEKFYKQPFYKAIDENVSPESTTRKSIEKQLEDGKIRFTA